ncbi:MAG: hypothetical protein H8E85_01935 [Candidatus Marinimicrobia bacterium]|nr:hypothetical protein [Candidatus Neomarinimicrobiota bacterium]
MAYGSNAPSLDRWKQMTLSEQMANIGSEVSRAIHWRKKKENVEFSNNALNRALELIFLTIGCVRIKSHYRELTRMREALKDTFFGNNDLNSTDLQWEKYFNHFNFVARKNK